MRILFGFFLVLLSMVAAASIGSASPAAPTPSEVYVSGSWRIDSFTLTESDGTTLSSGSLNPAEWSGSMTFRKGGRCDATIRSDDDGTKGAIRWASDDHIRAEGGYSFTLGTYDGNAVPVTFAFNGNADSNAVTFGEWDGLDGNPDHGAGGGTDPTSGDQTHVVHGLALTLNAGNGSTLYVVLRR